MRMPSLGSSTTSGWAFVRQTQRREKDHADGDEDKLDRHDDQDHSPDAAGLGRNLRRRLGWGSDRVDHEGSLRGKTKATADGSV